MKIFCPLILYERRPAKGRRLEIGERRARLRLREGIVPCQVPANIFGTYVSISGGAPKEISRCAAPVVRKG